jgi:hypothetical protein
VLENLDGGGRHIVIKSVAKARGHELHAFARYGHALGVQHGNSKLILPGGVATENTESEIGNVRFRFPPSPFRS